MAITSFINQYPVNDIRAGYQSSYLIAAGGVNPVVYFDVYINFAYYKTITSTTLYLDFLGLKLYRADLKDTVQEYLRSTPPFYVDLHGQPYLQSSDRSACQVYVRVRGSSLVSGVLVPDGIPPSQGTVTTAPSSGTGLQSNTWTFVNCTVQYDDEQNLKKYLTSITDVQAGTFYNLSPRQELHIGTKEAAWWPLLFQSNTDQDGIRLIVIDQDGVEYNPNATDYILFNGNSVRYVPIGPKNILQMPAGGLIPFHLMTWYKVAFKFIGGSFFFWKSPRFYLTKCKTQKRIYFMNWLGHFEPVNFYDWEEINHVTSETWEKRLDTEPFMGAKSQGGVTRFNVRTSNEVTVYAHFDEKDIRLMEEIQSTPAAYLEYYAPGQTTQTSTPHPGDLIPIHFLDIDIQKRKLEGRFFYEVALKYSNGHQKIHPRN